MAADPAYQRDEEPDRAKADRFLDLAKRLIAVPKDEIDRLRNVHGDDDPQPG